MLHVIVAAAVGKKAHLRPNQDQAVKIKPLA